MARILNASFVPDGVAPRVQKYWGSREYYPESDDECPIQWTKDTFIPQALGKLKGKLVTREALLEGLEKVLEYSKPGLFTSGAPVSLAIYIAVYTSSDEEIAKALETPEALEQCLESKLKEMMENGKLTPASLERYFCDKCRLAAPSLVSESPTPTNEQRTAEQQASMVRLVAEAPETYTPAALFTFSPNAASGGVALQKTMIT